MLEVLWQQLLCTLRLIPHCEAAEHNKMNSELITEAHAGKDKVSQTGTYSSGVQVTHLRPSALQEIMSSVWGSDTISYLRQRRLMGEADRSILKLCEGDSDET